MEETQSEILRSNEAALKAEQRAESLDGEDKLLQAELARVQGESARAVAHADGVSRALNNLQEQLTLSKEGIAGRQESDRQVDCCFVHCAV